MLGALSWIALAVLTGCGGSKGTAPPAPPPVVEVAPVERRDVDVTREWIGSLDGAVNAEIRPQVEGYVLKRTYREGDFVHRGETLFEIDPRQMQSALEQARSQLAHEEATLARAKIDVARFTPLVADKAVSQQELDNAIASEHEAQASVAAAQAAVNRERLNLGWTRVVSPIDGIAGVALAQVGNLVNGGTLMATVSTVDPIKAYFSLSEPEFMAWVRRYGAMDRPGALPGAKGMFQLVLSDGSVYPHRGDLGMADRNVDQKTGTIKLSALFPNPEHLLRPGQYAKVRLVETRTGALVVPERAIGELQGVPQVTVVGSDNKADSRPITIGDHVGALWTVEKGLSEGERVVVEGLQKVRPGIVVDPKPAAPAPGAPPGGATPSAGAGGGPAGATGASGSSGDSGPARGSR
jgi:membrane fusion protein (multidrug efflux system)